VAAGALAAADFADLLKRGQRRRSEHFSLHWRPATAQAHAAPLEATEASVAPAAAHVVVAVGAFGTVLSKRLARTAVRRNLIKRQGRALFDASLQLDVVLRLTARVDSLDRGMQFAELRTLFAALK
jgi:ribonuclease P protein component